MSMLLARLARTLSHHWKRGLAAALVVLVLLGAAAGAGGEAADDFAIPGTESQQALDLFKAHSPAFGGADSTLVFSVDEGRISDPEPRAAIEGALAKVGELPGVAQVSDPFARGRARSPQDGRLAQVDVRYTTDPADLEKADGEALIDAAETAEQGGAVQVEERGMLVDLAVRADVPGRRARRRRDRVHPADAAVPLGRGDGRDAHRRADRRDGGPDPARPRSPRRSTCPAFASVIAMMLGLGAGIDYSLLIIARYREQAAAGDSTRDAAAKAAATSGASVVAAGLIVMVAIAGLLVIGIPFIGKLGLASAIAVGAVVVSAITILPIMIGALARWLKPKKPEHVLPVARVRALGRAGHRAPVGLDRGRRRSCC